MVGGEFATHLLDEQRIFEAPTHPLNLFPRRNRLTVIPAAQKLVRLVVDSLSYEVDGTVHKGKVGPLGMPGPESPSDAIIGHGMLRSADVRPAPAHVIFIHRVIDGNNRGVELRAV